VVNISPTEPVESGQVHGATHSYVGPGRRETLRKAVGNVTDRLFRHGSATSEEPSQ
jgi:hypothetical protein